MPHHHASSPYFIIMPRHHASSPCLITMPHHHASSPCLITMPAGIDINLSMQADDSTAAHRLFHHDIALLAHGREPVQATAMTMGYGADNTQVRTMAVPPVTCSRQLQQTLWRVLLRPSSFFILACRYTRSRLLHICMFAFSHALLLLSCGLHIWDIALPCVYSRRWYLSGTLTAMVVCVCIQVNRMREIYVPVVTPEYMPMLCL